MPLALLFIALLSAQDASPSPASQRDAEPAHSATYTETVKRLKDWSEHCCVEADDQRFGWLFADGDLKKDDLIAACNQSDRDVKISAAKILQVTGAAESQQCLAAARPSFNSSPYVIGWANRLSESDFQRLDRTFASPKCEESKSCKEAGFPEVADSLVYALILDGSDRAVALLRRIYVLRGAGMLVRFPAETVDDAIALVSAARDAADQLGPVPTIASVRNAAFYIAPKYRKDAHVKFVGRSSDGNRMLLRVSYNCGMLCGEGYAIVIERHGNGWRYALITMEWIS